MARTIKSYPFKTLFAVLLFISGCVISIEAWYDQGGNLDSVIGITLFLSGVYAFMQVYLKKYDKAIDISK